MKQYTTVYHAEYGKGFVLTTKHRKDDCLVICSFPKENQIDFITEKELLSGQGLITLSRVRRSLKSPKDSIDEVLSGIFLGRG